MKKKAISIIFLVILVLNTSIPVAAEEIHSLDRNSIVGNGYLVISDPSTGEHWNWELSSSDVLVNQVNRSTNATNEIKDAFVSVDVGEYILHTMTTPIDADTTLYDDVTLTAGLRYAVDDNANAVSIYRAYGSAPDSGMFYATNKAFHYSNAYVFGTITKYPTGESWSYSTDSRPGSYNKIFCPSACLECRITVRGMESSYRDVAVTFTLDYV